MYSNKKCINFSDFFLRAPEKYVDLSLAVGRASDHTTIKKLKHQSNKNLSVNDALNQVKISNIGKALPVVLLWSGSSIGWLIWRQLR